MKCISKRVSISLIALFAFLTVSLGVYAMVLSRRADRLQTVVDSYNQRAVNELCESIDSITADLQKCLYSASKETLLRQGNKLCRQAAVAKESLASLNSETSATAEIYKFLSQVGNYTVAIGKSDGEAITAKDAGNLKKLCAYSKSLSDSLTEILTEYSDGTVSFDLSESLRNGAKELPEDFYSRINDTSQTITDYPVLLYDGPYSDLQGKGDYELLKPSREITENEAAEIAAELLSATPSSLRRDDGPQAEMELFSFSLGDSYVSVTKKGGYIASLLSSPQVSAASISPEEAITRASQFLEGIGYKSMKESYYTLYDGICTINFAFSQNGVICYSDLIKVSIALDTGKVTALEAGTFLANHKERSTEKPSLTKAQAQEKLSASLDVLATKRALIPDENGNEFFCYEFRVRGQGDLEALIYIDANTGEEREIMLLLYEDGGILTR